MAPINKGSTAIFGQYSSNEIGNFKVWHKLEKKLNIFIKWLFSLRPKVTWVPIEYLQGKPLGALNVNGKTTGKWVDSNLDSGDNPFMHPYYKINRSENVSYAPLPLPPHRGMSVPVHDDQDIRKGKILTTASWKRRVQYRLERHQ